MKKVLVFLFVVMLVSVALPKVTINLWHAMSGSRLPAVDAIVEGFNETHPEIEVVAQFTGSYAETLTKAICQHQPKM